MPGITSLQQNQYYAHTRNVFWPIMAELLGFERHCSYTDRGQKICAEGFALWDVLERCERKSSLDSDIEASTAIPNDIGKFLTRHASVCKIFFNGAKAESLFKRHLANKLALQLVEKELHRLPSTSPAYAAMGYQKKLDCWRKILE